MKKNIILDVDTGVDDAIAIIIALHHPKLSIKAITTVAGNVDVEQVTRNTQIVLGLNRSWNDISVGKGSSVSLRRTHFNAPEVHGENGLGNVHARYEKYMKKRTLLRAVPLLLNTITNSKTPLEIIATGPLTNIARAIQRKPQTMKKLQHIYSMGGVFNKKGNTGPLAEFNYYVDPLAVEIVAQSGIPLSVIPLNVTEKVVFLRDEIRELVKKYPSIVTKFIWNITKYYSHYHRKTESFHGCYLHDPVTVLLAAQPALAHWEKKPFLIETKGIYTSGTTLTRDAHGRENTAPIVRIATVIDHKTVKRIILNVLKKI